MPLSRGGTTNRGHEPERGPRIRHELETGLNAFGEARNTELMTFTVTEALQGEQRWSGSKPVREALECIEAAAKARASANGRDGT